MFTKAEILDLEKSPEALRVLADIHDCYATMADAVGDAIATSCVLVHENRAAELRNLACKIEAEY